MQTPTPPGSTYVSPKRKRSVSSIETSPFVTRITTTDLLDQSTCESDIISEGSPRTAVAGHLQNLDLDKQQRSIGVDFCKASEEEMVPRKRSVRDEEEEDQSHIHSQNSNNTPLSPPSTLLEQSNPALKTFPHEIPETPRPTPVSPTMACVPSRTSNKSPVPSSSTLWWTDKEITGHNPTDPSDDGYGINGVGFIPTAAVANARAERRKRQVADWKNREAKDARQKRSDMRRRKEADIEHLKSIEGLGADESRKVRFLEV